MELKVKLMDWDAGLPVAMLNEKTAEKMGVHPQDMISIGTLSKKPKGMSTIIDVVKGLVKENEVAVSSELKKNLGLKIGQKVEVNISSPPKSMDFIKKKMNNKSLSQEEIHVIIEDVVNNSLSDAEIALFVSSMYKYGLSMKETIYLIKAILKTGSVLKLKNKFVGDKHSIGGVPGNRTTPIVVSICAAAGIIMPKNSSRAITSAAGTADVIETIANVEFSIEELLKIVKKTNACMVWGGSLEMVPADSKIIQLEKSLKLDPEAMLVASIMSKKLAADSKFIVIDIPYGKGAKVNLMRALRIKKKFAYLGRYFKVKIKCVLTDGSQPIGNGVGPALELIDLIKVLNPEEIGPRDLEKKSLFLAGELLEMSGKAKKGKGQKLAAEILYSGKAFKKFEEIIKAQGGSLDKLKDFKFKHNIMSMKTGKIRKINNKGINSLARTAGSPVDKFAGVFLHFKVGEKVKKGQKLITLYAESNLRLKEAIKYYEREKPIKIR